MSKAHLTAIVRNKLSAPAKELIRLRKIKGSVLDYGCGKGDDVKFLTEKGYCIRGYDPHWKDDLAVLCREYDTILCSYVYNVVDESTRESITRQLKALRKKNGKIYITVRTDIKEDYLSKRGTNQYVVHLDLPIVVKTADFCTYELL